MSKEERTMSGETGKHCRYQGKLAAIQYAEGGGSTRACALPPMPGKWILFLCMLPGRLEIT